MIKKNEKESSILAIKPSNPPIINVNPKPLGNKEEPSNMNPLNEDKEWDLISKLIDKDQFEDDWKSTNHKKCDVELLELIVSPPTITTKEKEIALMFHIKNNGKYDYPEGAYLKNIGDWSQKALIPSLKIDKEYGCEVIAKSPRKAGKYESKWIVGYKTRYGDEITIGQPFFLSYIIVDAQKEYSTDVTAKAEYLKSIFPDKDLEFYCKFIESNAEVGVEDLVEKLLSAN